MNSMNDQNFFDLAMKAIARQASHSERAELDALLTSHPELKAEFDRLQADARTAKETLALVNATKATSPELPAYLRGRLQTKVRQTLGRSKASDEREQKREMVWNWRRILRSVTGATAVVLLLLSVSIHLCFHKMASPLKATFPPTGQIQPMVNAAATAMVPTPSVQTPVMPVPKPPDKSALVLYGESTIKHDIADTNPIRLACLARNPPRLDFVSSNSGLLPNANISFKLPDSAAGETNGWILLQPRRGYTGEADVVITAAGKELLSTTNAVHLKIVGEPTPPRIETASGGFVLKPGGKTNITVKVSSDYFAPGELSLINKTNDPPNLLMTDIQRKGDGFALDIQALRQPQPGKVTIELLLEAPNGTFAPKVFFVSILQPPWITGPATNMIRSTGERSRPIQFAVTGSAPPLSFDGGFGPELLHKYDLQWESNGTGTNLTIMVTAKPPQDLQRTETFTTIVGDAFGQRVTNEFIFQLALRENSRGTFTPAIPFEKPEIAPGDHLKRSGSVPAGPIELNNSQVNLPSRAGPVVNLPANHWKKIPISVPYAGILSIELRVTKGNPVNVALIRADGLAGIEQANGVIHSKKLLRASLPEFKAVKARVYNQKHQIDKGDFLIVLQDTTLGILSASTSDIEIHVYLNNK